MTSLLYFLGNGDVPLFIFFLVIVKKGTKNYPCFMGGKSSKLYFGPRKGEWLGN